MGFRGAWRRAVCGLRTGVTVHLSPTDRKRLQAIVDDRNSVQKHVWRARIVLGTADDLGKAAILRTAGVIKTSVWRWQARFMDEGVEGLLHDKTRPPGTPRLTEDAADRIVALTLAEPPGETTHWTGGLMAKVAGVGLTSVPRTRPGLPLKKGRAGTMTTRTTARPPCSPPSRCWKARSSALHAAPPASGVHPVPERHRVRGPGRKDHPRLTRVSYTTHKHPRVIAWLGRHPRWTLHFTPISASWLNAVEGFFAILTRRRLKRGVFKGIVNLQAAINRFGADKNQQPKPFVWTADYNTIIVAAARGRRVMESIH